MDIKIERSAERRYRLFKEFEHADLIPYSLALIMIAGYVYLIYQFIHLAPFALKD